MGFRGRTTLVGALLVGIVLSPKPATAIEPVELKDLKVVGHFRTTRVAGTRRSSSIKDQSKFRVLILKLAATVREDDAVVFTPDFVLAYYHRNRREARATCRGIAKAKTPSPGETGTFSVGRVLRLKMGPGQVYFALAFSVAPDVEMVELHRIGGQPVTYSVGTDRPYSVMISTNAHPELLSQVKELAEQAGLQATYLSTKLNKKKTGTTIHYTKHSESAARELSQRLMTKLRIVPTLKKIKLAAKVDMVVWLGK